MAFDDLLKTENQNLAGIVGEIFWAPVEDIATFPVLSAAGAGDTTADDIVMGAGKKFLRLYHTDETGKLDANMIGERDGKAAEAMLEWFYPGASAKLIEQKRQMQNTPGVFICKDTDGNYRILGVVNLDPTGTVCTGDIPAYMESGNSTSGAKRADRRGTTFQVKWSGPHDPIIYKGAVPIVAV